MRLPASWMPRIAAFLEKISTPYDDIGDYMNRRWVFRLGRWGRNAKYGWIAGRLNLIKRSDTDRALHDHPWPYITLILRGGYYEVTEAGFDGMRQRSGMVSQWYGPGSILFRGTKHKHRLIIPEGRSALTFFITLPYAQGWGFFVGDKKIPYAEYLKDNKQ